MATGMGIVEAARQFLGAPYKFWTGVYPEYGPPGYNDWQDPGYYTPGYVVSEGVHCAGEPRTYGVRSYTYRADEAIWGLALE